MVTRSATFKILENHDPADAALKRSHGGLTAMDSSAVRAHRATASPAPVPLRSLTGIRFAVVDESASLIGSGVL